MIYDLVSHSCACYYYNNKLFDTWPRGFFGKVYLRSNSRNWFCLSSSRRYRIDERRRRDSSVNETISRLPGLGVGCIYRRNSDSFVIVILIDEYLLYQLRTCLLLIWFMCYENSFLFLYCVIFYAQ